MELRYSGASKADGIQKSPNLSLGGFVSGTIVPNDSLGNILSEVSLLNQQNLTRETKMIILKNTSGSSKTGISILPTFTASDNYDYKIGFASPKAGSTSCFESIASSKDLPYNSTFVTLVSGTLIIPPTATLSDGQMFGIWIQRQLKKPDAVDCDSVTPMEPNSFTDNKLTLAISYT